MVQWTTRRSPWRWHLQLRPAARTDCGSQGLDNLAATRAKTSLPIIGIIKRDLTDSLVRITPFIEDVHGLASGGADIIAYDATQRQRPVPTAELVRAIQDAGRIAMADCATIEDARHALAEIDPVSPAAKSQSNWQSRCQIRQGSRPEADEQQAKCYKVREGIEFASRDFFSITTIVNRGCAISVPIQRKVGEL